MAIIFARACNRVMNELRDGGTDGEMVCLGKRMNVVLDGIKGCLDGE